MTEADPAILVASSLDPIISITSISTSDAKIEKFRNKAVINRAILFIFLTLKLIFFSI